jgi:hypothetical protein
MFLAGLREMGGGGGTGSADMVARTFLGATTEEKVIRSLAFSFINLTTFSLRIETSVRSSSTSSCC